MLSLGIDEIRENPNISLAWGNCLFLGNQASLPQNFKPAWETLREILGSRLKGFLGPQHGFLATVQDNMIESSHQNSGPFGLPIYSLYSETREPLSDMLLGIDTIVVDLQIVGCRVYTFKYTIAACLRAAQKYNKRVVILDRPNPLGGVHVEGRVLDLNAKSFVGEFPLPMRHALSVAEAALFFNQTIGAQLEVVPMQGWKTNKIWHEYFKHWFLTSPNLPTIESVYVYPATVMLEGTNISEGRGTGLPFQFVGAPYIRDTDQLVRLVQHYYLGEGIYLRPTEFQPTSQKWAGETCRGFQIHVLDANKIKTFKLGLSIIKAFADLGGNSFAWKQPPYEYDFKNAPIDLILGEIGAKKMIESGFDLRDDYWSLGINDYIQTIEKVLLYPRKLINFN